jgi:hypothetical protein
MRKTGANQRTFCFLRLHSVHDFASRRLVRLTASAGVCCIPKSGNDALPASMHQHSNLTVVVEEGRIKRLKSK